MVIYTDSQWSLNMITGKWRPKTNKDLVLLAQTLAYEAGIKTSFQWVKGHAGHYYYCIADGLAAQGRDSKEYKGGRRQPIATHASQTTPPTMHGSLTDFLNAAKHSAQEHFPLQQRTIAKPWIREATLRALAQARVAQAEQSEDWKKLRNQAKRLARKDRVHWVHEQLLADPAGTTSPVWNTVRRQRKGFQGRRTQLIVEGKPVPWTSTHVAFRNHLQDTQWGQPHIPDHSAQKRSTRLPLRQPAPDEPLFTRGELLDALGKTKKGKAPGPDGIVNEILQLLDAEGERRLLEFYNEVWNNRTTPPDWSHATIVSIYKGKGDDSDPASYRPISLLNVTYKVYAAMLQARLASAFDERLRPQQFGFRAGRGTRHPLFVVRRAMEWSTMTNRNLQLLFLDWKQAFDSLDHTAMLQALQRFGLSHKMLDNIKSIYANPTFQTVGLDHTAVGQVKAGIRQGCPLSPYLFLVVLTVIFEDLDGELQQRGVPTNTWSEGFPVADMEYADDTLLLALTTPQLQSILSALEELAAEYGMSLNKMKTELLVRPNYSEPALRFKDGSSVPAKTVVKYLGSMISWTKPFETAFYHRAALAEEAFKKLRLIWNSTLCLKERLKIFQATFLPVLTYGLDALTLTTPHLKRIDAFYIRFLRRVVRIKASYYSRIPNVEVYEQAHRPRLPSHLLSDMQYKMMREVFLAPRKEVYHSVVFGSAHKDRILSQGRRRGMQFPYWVEVVSRQYFPHICNSPDHPALGPHFQYAQIHKELRNPQLGKTPKRADWRAGP